MLHQPDLTTLSIKYTLRDDKGPLRDFYFFRGLEELTPIITQGKLRNWVVYWPPREDDSVIRVDNLHIILTTFCYVLSQQGISCSIIRESEPTVIAAITRKQAKETHMPINQDKNKPALKSLD